MPRQYSRISNFSELGERHQRQPEASFGDMAREFDHLFENPDDLTALEASSHDELLKKHSARTVLDCACGTGIQSIGLALLGYHVSASDISVNMLNQLKAKVQSKHLKIDIKWADFRNLESWSGRKFDAVICSGNSLTLVPKRADVGKALASMVRVTRAGGIGIIGLHNYPRLEQKNEVFHLRHVGDNKKPEIVFDFREFGKRRVKVTYFFLRLVGARWRLKTHIKSYLSLTPDALMNEMRKAGYQSIRLHDISGQREFDDDEWVLAVGETQVHPKVINKVVLR